MENQNDWRYSHPLTFIFSAHSSYTSRPSKCPKFCGTWCLRMSVLLRTQGACIHDTQTHLQPFPYSLEVGVLVSILLDDQTKCNHNNIHAHCSVLICPGILFQYVANLLVIAHFVSSLFHHVVLICSGIVLLVSYFGPPTSTPDHGHPTIQSRLVWDSSWGEILIL